MKPKLSQAQKESIALHAHSEEQHNNPPQPFNPSYSKQKMDLWRSVVAFVHNEPEDESRTRTERADRILHCFTHNII